MVVPFTNDNVFCFTHSAGEARNLYLANASRRRGGFYALYLGDNSVQISMAKRESSPQCHPPIREAVSKLIRRKAITLKKNEVFFPNSPCRSMDAQHTKKYTDAQYDFTNVNPYRRLSNRGGPSDGKTKAKAQLRRHNTSNDHGTYQRSPCIRRIR